MIVVRKTPAHNILAAIAVHFVASAIFIRHTQRVIGITPRGDAPQIEVHLFADRTVHKSPGSAGFRALQIIAIAHISQAVGCNVVLGFRVTHIPHLRFCIRICSLRRGSFRRGRCQRIARVAHIVKTVHLALGELGKAAKTDEAPQNHQEAMPPNKVEVFHVCKD